MKKFPALLLFTLMMTACSTPEPLVIEWQETDFLYNTSHDVQNVTDILIADDGTVLVSYYDGRQFSYVAQLKSFGSQWDAREITGITNPRALRQLSDGSFLLGGSAHSQGEILYHSEDGLTWWPVETTGVTLPNQWSATVWDILELPDGRILLGTDSKDNAPEEMNPNLLVLDGEELSVMASFYGLGILSMEMDLEGNLYIATQESSEHDDPELAGQAHIWRSTDMGENWEEVAVPVGANRVYDMLAHSDGSLYLGTGISGELFRSTDQGDTWETLPHVPAIEVEGRQSEGIVERPASRIYQMIELTDGSLLVGTGNKEGGIFLSQDGGTTWTNSSTPDYNVVTWGLAQDPDTGRIWAGTGSFGGDVFTTLVE